MVNNYQEVKEILKKYKQNHVIRFLEGANDEIKDKLIEQILKIDFEELKELYEKTFEEIYVDLEEMQPIEGINPDRLPDKKIRELENIGIEIIKNNKFALATMAGGQGSSLGHC